MDNEQRERLRDLTRTTRRGLLTGGALVVVAVVIGVLLRDDWTALLWTASLGLVSTLVVFVSQWRYIRRGLFPRLPTITRAEDPPEQVD